MKIHGYLLEAMGQFQLLNYSTYKAFLIVSEIYLNIKGHLNFGIVIALHKFFAQLSGRLK